MAKLGAYELQAQGLDTVEANERLGYEADSRDFVLPAKVLRLAGYHSDPTSDQQLLKLEALQGAGIEVVRERRGRLLHHGIDNILLSWLMLTDCGYQPVGISPITRCGWSGSSEITAMAFMPPFVTKSIFSSGERTRLLAPHRGAALDLAECHCAQSCE